MMTQVQTSKQCLSKSLCLLSQGLTVLVERSGRTRHGCADSVHEHLQAREHHVGAVDIDPFWPVEVALILVCAVDAAETKTKC